MRIIIPWGRCTLKGNKKRCYITIPMDTVGAIHKSSAPTEEYAVAIEAVGAPVLGRPRAGSIDDAIGRVWEAARYGLHCRG